MAARSSPLDPQASDLLSSDSALFAAGQTRLARIYLAFGGQGAANSVCLKELQRLRNSYGSLFTDLFEDAAALLYQLSSDTETNGYFRDRRIDLKAWLLNPDAAPSRTTLAMAPFSMPIIGLLGLIEYCVVCRNLGKTPGEVRTALSGAMGHSQGIVVATVVSLAGTWDDLRTYAKEAIELLFWIGYYSQAGAPKSQLPISAVTDSLEHGEGSPAPLLSVRGLKGPQIERVIARINDDLPEQKAVYLALANTADNFILAGPAASLKSVCLYLRTISAKEGENDAKIPFNLRKPHISLQFLPVSIPFHTPYMTEAASKIKQKLSSLHMLPECLEIPVLHTYDGSDLRTNSATGIPDMLVDAITSRFADWPKTVASCEGATHIVTLGAGRIGDLVTGMVDGSGIRVIRGSEPEGSTDGQTGGREDLFARSLPKHVLRPTSWKEEYAPHLSISSSGTFAIETKLSRTINAPPVIVAGMTPTTVPWDFVSTIINAGYHAELAGGGYYDATSMSTAISKLVNSIPKGRGITINLIYSSPKSMAWQIPLLKRLRSQNVPIDGLTIGAGVPSLETAASYIEDLGLKHIAFKPGATSAIFDVLRVAEAFPSFPIILQWTGGQGGGHHSYEDFHEPILNTYSQIRRHKNVVLIAGSGFGDDVGSMPYLTGEWSQSYGRPAMPFDGILLGSRMMVAREAHTSLEAKKLIYEAPGADPSVWHQSYQKPVGGVITVKSEMGQPIHKLATRGVLFWSEMDPIFALPKAKKTEEIQRKKEHIIQRLNADFAKPFFGIDEAGNPTELSNMTCAQVLKRSIQLMYVRHQRRWVHSSYATFVTDIAARILERLGGQMHRLASEMEQRPVTLLSELCKSCPAALTTRIYPEDVSYFLSRCRARGQKPVNFVPVIDAELEHWMKKDSLWQSEDVDAVFEQDVGRICILHGPVAAKHSTKTDESAQDILDSIYLGLVHMFQDSPSSVNSVFTSCENVSTPFSELDSPTLDLDDSEATTFTDRTALLQRVKLPWLQALLTDQTYFRGSEVKHNAFKDIADLPGTVFSFEAYVQTLKVLQPDENGSLRTVATFSTAEDNAICVCLRYYLPEGPAQDLLFEFRLNTQGRVLYLEDMTQSSEPVQTFYTGLWMKQSERPKADENGFFFGRPFTLTQSLVDQVSAAVGLAESMSLCSSSPEHVPIDVLTMVAWDSLVQPLLAEGVGGDLLNLVHLSNRVEYVQKNVSLEIGQTFSSDSSVSMISIEDAGKVVEVRATIRLLSEVVAIVTSSFMFKGRFNDFQNTFKTTEEPEFVLKIDSRQDEALLSSRDWFRHCGPTVDLIGSDLLFKSKTHLSWKTSKTYSKLEVKGTVHRIYDEGRDQIVAEIDYSTTNCLGNPVIDYLQRYGQIREPRKLLQNPGWNGKYEHELLMPAGNEAYSRLSGDINPIHTSTAFAAWAGFSQPITHGMYTSAIARHIVENEVADGDSSRFRSFSTQFVGAVMPRDKLLVQLQHIAMFQGRMVFQVTVKNQETGDDVIRGEAEIEQPKTTYIFTGQGSQAKGMGMDLYASSAVAKKVWDDSDRFFIETYGLSILQIVRNNPKSVTLHFQGARGRRIRQNYLDFTIEQADADGTIRRLPALPELTPRSSSYTFSDSRGLLFLTQFAQPAITILSRASFEDMKSRGVVQPGATFAGHSLGEYAALACLSEFMDFLTTLRIVFYRGLTMQVAMKRDEQGRTEFGMVAVSPARVGKVFDQQALCNVLSRIVRESGALLEIVNFNVDGEQYVCAGHLRNIAALTTVLDTLYRQSSSKSFASELAAFAAASDEPLTATGIGRTIGAALAAANKLPKPIELKRGRATIPLAGIDVPFHSTHLQPAVAAYRKYLESHVRVEDVWPERLVDRWIPNVTGTRFALDNDSGASGVILAA